MHSSPFIQVILFILVSADHRANAQQDVECPEGQTFMTCGSACDRTCHIPDPICTEQCVARCQCVDSTPLLHNGKCIAATECPSDDGCTEELVHCLIDPCEVNTCAKYPDAICKSDFCGGCNAKFYHADGILIHDCDGCGRPQASVENSKTRDCAAACTRTCADPNPECIDDCHVMCACPDPSPIADGGRCIPYSACPIETIPDCYGGQQWHECGMDCIRTCADPNPICNKRCVSKCQCPIDAPFWEVQESGRGRCVTKEQCRLNTGDCVHDGEGKEVGDTWQKDVCTTCHCVAEQEASDGVEVKSEVCHSIYCAMPICDTQIVYSEDYCCPFCAEQCTFDGVTYTVGESWTPDDCTECWCLASDNEEGKIQECKKEKCEKPRCGMGVDLVFQDGDCCPKCDDPCVYKGTEYEVGQEWMIDDCVTCTCYHDTTGTGKAQSCVAQTCEALDCDSYTPPGQCCPSCQKPCTFHDEQTNSIERREHWITDDCRECYCKSQLDQYYHGFEYEECTEMECKKCDNPIEIPGGGCCSLCLEPCQVYENGVIVDKTEWKRDPCTTCQCIQTATGEWTEMCAVMDCAQPNCSDEDLISNPDQCCPTCKSECYFNGTDYHEGSTWKQDACTTCTCVADTAETAAGSLRAVCRSESCVDTSECKNVDVRPGSCCVSYCLEACSYVDRETGEVVVLSEETEYHSDPCTVCRCYRDESGGFDSKCRAISCPDLDPNCTPVQKEGQCCPVCREDCQLDTTIDHGWAVSRSGRGLNREYTFQCEPGYWFAEGSSDSAYCDRKGNAVYPVCEAVRLMTRLVRTQDGEGASVVNVMYNRTGRGSDWGLLCDDGFGDAEAKWICGQNNYTNGRSVSLSGIKGDFLLTSLSCSALDSSSCTAQVYGNNSLPCSSAEIAGVFCYNADFEYESSNLRVAVKRNRIEATLNLSAFKHGRALELKKKGTFQLGPDDFYLVSSTYKLKPNKIKIKMKNGVATIKLSTNKPKNARSDDCFFVRVLGPSAEYDYRTDAVCVK